VLIVIYAAALLLLYLKADNSAVTETIWGRYVFLLGGLEPIVFAAVGWLFGREVNRKQAEQAGQATATAAAATADAAATAAKAETFRASILALTGSAEPTVLGAAFVGDVVTQQQPSGVLDAIRAQAQSVSF